MQVQYDICSTGRGEHKQGGESCQTLDLGSYVAVPFVAMRKYLSGLVFSPRIYTSLAEREEAVREVDQGQYI